VARDESRLPTTPFFEKHYPTGLSYVNLSPLAKWSWISSPAYRVGVSQTARHLRKKGTESLELHRLK
jgi:hypothetical protein